MIAISVLLGLLSMLAYSLSNVTSQPLARKLGPSKTLFSRNVTATLALAILTIPSYHHFHNVHEVLLALGLGIAGYLPVLAYVHGIKVSRVGIVTPIAGTSALITVIGAFIFLHVSIHPIQWLAIAVVILANVAISINPKDIKSSNIMQLASGVPYGLIAALGWGLFYFGLIYPTRALSPLPASFLVEAGVTLAAGTHLLVSKQTLFDKTLIEPKVIRNGLLIVVGTTSYAIGVYKYNVGIIAVLSNSTALASALLAAYLFKEKLSQFEKIVAAVMIAGVILVSLP